MSSESDGILNLYMEQSQDGILLTDAVGTIVYANRAAHELLCYAEGALAGKDVAELTGKDGREKFLRMFEHLKSEPKARCVSAPAEKHCRRFIEKTYSSLRGEDGSFCGLSVVARDVTRQRKALESQANIARMHERTLTTLRLQYHNVIMGSMETLSNMLESRDVYMRGHSARVAATAATMYESKFGLSDYALDLQTAARLHDIGKMCIPDSILNKPGDLTKNEFQIIKSHSAMAADIIKPLDPVGRISGMIRHHHERWDGKGYPDGLAGSDIPLGARIIAIADSYDAMISERTYRKARTFAESIAEMRKNAGTQFDPEWVDVFCELAEKGTV